MSEKGKKERKNVGPVAGSDVGDDFGVFGDVVCFAIAYAEVDESPLAHLSLQSLVPIRYHLQDHSCQDGSGPCRPNILVCQTCSASPSAFIVFFSWNRVMPYRRWWSCELRLLHQRARCRTASSWVWGGLGSREWYTERTFCWLWWLLAEVLLPYAKHSVTIHHHKCSLAHTSCSRQSKRWRFCAWSTECDNDQRWDRLPWHRCRRFWGGKWTRSCKRAALGCPIQNRWNRRRKRFQSLDHPCGSVASDRPWSLPPASTARFLRKNQTRWSKLIKSEGKTLILFLW